MWIPDATTLRRVFALLDAAAPDTALEVWAARASSPALGQRRRIAVNGRTLRGTRAGDTPGQYLLVTLDLTGTVVTADALHTQRDTATWLVARGARCFPTAKANQSTLHAQLTALT
ncbi:hypothetical protein MXD61_04960 [Frankia sp. AgPm24]|uniref:hypothetical protein n=1 Tax=Frankia sp. AgPm24 TaxID=631128 RepID=UPI00200D5254|nr:hypothetical protein [Frankia sp. AgPm24]MCK9921256.1 hypothetical protein [Frankia sp. AgPm24]